jgi:hypothetical protein
LERLRVHQRRDPVHGQAPRHPNVGHRRLQALALGLELEDAGLDARGVGSNLDGVDQPVDGSLTTLSRFWLAFDLATAPVSRRWDASRTSGVATLASQLSREGVIASSRTYRDRG